MSRTRRMERHLAAALPARKIVTMEVVTTGWPRPILYESHMHTLFCGHAEGEIDDYAAVAQRRNLKGIIVTCHNPLPDSIGHTVRMPTAQFRDYLDAVAAARKQWAGRIDIRLGLECDYMPGLENWLAEQTRSAQFDFLLASVHPHLREYQSRYWLNGAVDFQRTYFEHIAAAAEMGLFDCIAHPDVVKQVVGKEWDAQRVMPDICRCLDRIARTGVAMEFNTSAYENGYDELCPGEPMLREMARRRIPVVVGSDAHRPGRIGDLWLEAYEQLERCGYESVSFFLERKRIDVPIAEARRSLSGR